MISRQMCMHDSPRHYALLLLVSEAGNDVPNLGVPSVVFGQQLSNSKEGARCIKSGLTGDPTSSALPISPSRLLNQLLYTKDEEDGKEEICLRRRRRVRPGVGVCRSGDPRYNCYRYNETSSF